MPLPIIRDDLSTKLIHLTRGDNLENTVRNFIKILKEKKLIGSTKDIRGGYKCICFTEAPVSKLALVLSMASDMRYAPLGVIIDKNWLYSQGGRPVIYQSNDEYEYLPEAIRYRHVRFEPTREIDYSWEREWRVKVDELPLDPTTTTFIIPTRKWYEKIMGNWFSRVRLLSFAGFPVLGDKPSAFFILEDLGIPFTNEYATDEAIRLVQ